VHAGLLTGAICKHKKFDTRCYFLYAKTNSLKCCEERRVNRVIRAADALGIRAPKNVRSKLAKILAAILTLSGLALPSVAGAATLTSASMSLSDSRPYNATGPVAASVTYTFTGSSVTRNGSGSGNIKCIKEVFSSTNTPGSPTLPTGMVTTSATWNAAGTNYVPQSAGTWTANVATNGSIFLHNATAEEPASASARTVQFDAIRNSTTTDTGLYVFFSTWTGDFSSGDCTGSQLDTTTVQYVLTNGQLMSLTVDGTLSFTVVGQNTGACGSTGATATVDATGAGNTIPFGTVNTSNSVVCQKVHVATNATNGYAVYIRDTGQLANALAQKIPDNATTNGSPGAFATLTSGGNSGSYAYATDDFDLTGGTNTRFNATPNNWAAYLHGNGTPANDTTANKPVADRTGSVSGTSGDNYVAHEVGTTGTTLPGTYTTTVVYTCTPVY
jgi:hypothetical protein